MRKIDLLSPQIRDNILIYSAAVITGIGIVGLFSIGAIGTGFSIASITALAFNQLIIHYSSNISLFFNGIKISGLQHNGSDLKTTVDEVINSHPIFDSLKGKVNVYLSNSLQNNAFASGTKKSNPIITINQGLINNLSTNQLKGIIAHELGHLACDHIKKNILFYALSNIFKNLAESYSEQAKIAKELNNKDNGTKNLSNLATFFSLAHSATHNLKSFLSRSHEYEADDVAARAGYGPHLVSALRKISNPHEDGILQFINEYTSSHPLYNNRVSAIIENCYERANPENNGPFSLLESIKYTLNKIKKSHTNPFNQEITLSVAAFTENLDQPRIKNTNSTSTSRHATLPTPTSNIFAQNIKNQRQANTPAMSL